MTDIHEATAAQLEQALKDRATHDAFLLDMVTKATQNLRKRAFWSVYEDKRMRAINAVYYRSFDLVHDRAEYRADVVYINQSLQGETCVMRKRETWGTTFESIDDLTRNHRGQIDPKMWRRLWNTPVVIAGQLMTQLEPLIGQQPIIRGDFEQQDPSDEGIELDVPNIQLQPGESTLLPQCFMLPGNRYVLSPNSIAAGLARLGLEERNLMRGSHLFEECDMRYVETKQMQFRRLRACLSGRSNG